MPRGDFTWDAKASRYRDAGGRYVSSLEVRRALDVALAAQSRRIEGYGRSMAEGQLSLEAWRMLMRRAIKDSHLYSAAAARGGWAQLTPADYGRVGSAVRVQYQYLERFAGQISSGEVPLDGRVTSRTAMYAQASRSLYETMRGLEEAERNGMEQERNVLHPAEHCSECLAQTRRGWVGIGTLIPVGARTCIVNCKCTLIYRKRPRPRVVKRRRKAANA